jgi:drug/metabolite transporter (DMT)-like permease
MLGVAGIATGELGRVHPTEVSMSAVAAIAYLILFGSLIAYSAYGWLLRTISVSMLSTHAYVNPVVAVALGALVLGEPLSVATLAAAALIVLSVVLLIGLPKRSTRARLPRPIALPEPASAEFSRLAA